MHRVEVISEEPPVAEYKCSGYNMRLFLEKRHGEPYEICIRLPESLARTFDVGVPVSGRDEYYPQFSELEVDPRLQYIEIGPGLGYFIPHLVGLQDTVRSEGGIDVPKPIAIDMANFNVVKALLESGQEFSQRSDMPDLLRDLETRMERCGILTDPDKVRLISNRVENVVHKGYLMGTADRVVDHCGPVHYANRASEEERLIRDETSFLTRGGRHFYVSRKRPNDEEPLFIGWTEPKEW